MLPPRRRLESRPMYALTSIDLDDASSVTRGKATGRE